MSGFAQRVRADEVIDGVLPAIGAVCAWLLPPTAYGIVYIRFWESDTSLWADQLVEFCFYWGYLGIVVAPLAAALLGLRFRQSRVSAWSAAAFATLAYYPASLFALAVIMAFDPFTWTMQD